jgi:hypothetical protein
LHLQARYRAARAQRTLAGRGMGLYTQLTLDSGDAGDTPNSVPAGNQLPSRTAAAVAGLRLRRNAKAEVDQQSCKSVVEACVRDYVEFAAAGRAAHAGAARVEAHAHGSGGQLRNPREWSVALAGLAALAEPVLGGVEGGIGNAWRANSRSLRMQME